MHRLALGLLLITSLGFGSGCSHPHQSTHYHSKHRAKLSYLDFTPLNEEKVQRKQVVKKALSLLDGRVASSHGHRFDSNPLGLFALRIGKLASSCSQNLLSLESAVWKISSVVLKKDDKFFMGHRVRAILFSSNPRALRRLPRRAALRQDSVTWPSSRRSLPTAHSSWSAAFDADQPDLR